MNSTSWFEEYKVTVPEGKQGEWEISRFKISPDDSNMTHAFSVFNNGRGTAPPGIYTKLTNRYGIMMSDTPDEIRDHRKPMTMACGHVLINGLGLGMVLQGCLNSPDVKNVTVVEKSPDVIALCEGHYTEMAERLGVGLEIIGADCFEWRPPKGIRYNVVWHDIWQDLCLDNLPEMHKLHRKFGRRADWQGSWGREFLERQKRQGTRYYR